MRPPLPESWSTASTRVDAAANVPRERVIVAWPTPAYGQPDDAALDMAGAILADSEGRLQHQLLHGGLVAGVGARQSSFRRSSAFSLAATVADGQSAEQVVLALEDAIGHMATTVTAEECARARDEWSDAMLLRLQTSSGRAQWLAGASSPTWGLAKYEGIGPAEVTGAVRRMLASRSRTVIVVKEDARYPGRGVLLRRTRDGG